MAPGFFSWAGDTGLPFGSSARAEAEVQAVLEGQTGDDWARARRLLTPEAFTFLDRVHEQLAALPVPAEFRQAAVQAETLRRRPELLRGDTPAAAVARGLLLVAGVTLSLGQETGTRALALVRGVLDRACRSRPGYDTDNRRDGCRGRRSDPTRE